LQALANVILPLANFKIARWSRFEIGGRSLNYSIQTLSVIVL